MPQINQFFSVPNDGWKAIYKSTSAEDLFRIFQINPNHRRLACEALFNQDTDDAIFFQAELVAYWLQTDDLNLLWLPDLETIKKAISSLKFPNKLLGQMLVNRLTHKEYDLSLIQGELNQFVNRSDSDKFFSTALFFWSTLKLVGPYLSQEQKQQCVRSFLRSEHTKFIWLRSLDDDDPWLAPFSWGAMDSIQQHNTLQWILDNLLYARSQSDSQLMLSSLRSLGPYWDTRLRITAVEWCMKKINEDPSLESFIAVSPVVLDLIDNLNPSQLSLLDEQTDKCLHSNQISLITSAIDVLSIRFPFLKREDQQKTFKRIITLLKEGNHSLIYQYIIDAMPMFLPHLDAGERAFFLESVCKYWVKHATFASSSSFPVALTSSLSYFDEADTIIVPLLFDELDSEGFYLRNAVVREIKKALPYIKDKEELEKRLHQLLPILADKEEDTDLRITALDTVVRSLFLLPNSPQKMNMMLQVQNEVVENKKLLKSFIKMLPDYMAQIPQKEQKAEVVLWLVSLVKHEEDKVAVNVLSVLPLYFPDMEEGQKMEVMRQIKNTVLGNKNRLSSFIKMFPSYMAQIPQNKQTMEWTSWLLSQLDHEDDEIALDALSVLPLYFSDIQEEQKELVMKRFWSFVEKSNLKVTERYVPYLNDEEYFKIFDLRLKRFAYSDGEALLTLLRVMEEKSSDAVDLLLIELNRPEMLAPDRRVILNVLSSFLLNDAPEPLVGRAHEKNQGTCLESMLLKQVTTLLRAPIVPAPSFGM